MRRVDQEIGDARRPQHDRGLPVGCMAAQCVSNLDGAREGLPPRAADPLADRLKSLGLWLIEFERWSHIAFLAQACELPEGVRFEPRRSTPGGWDLPRRWRGGAV